MSNNLTRWMVKLAALLFAPAVVVVACSKEPATVADLACKDCNVLLLTVDALRADALPCYGGPKEVGWRICSLADHGIFFERARTTAPLTWPSLDAMMTGTMLSNGRFEDYLAALARKPTLAEVLKSRGYSTAAFTTHPALDVMSDEKLRASSPLRRGFDVFRGLAPKPPSEKPTAHLLSAAVSTWLEENQNRRFFAWVHLYDTHATYSPYEAYAQRLGYDPKSCGDAEKLANRFNPKSTTPFEAKCLRRLYEAEAAYVDEHVGKILDVVSNLGLADHTIVIATADHGEEFLEKGLMGHWQSLNAGALGVPLLVRSPRTMAKGHGRIGQTVSTAAIRGLVLDALDGREPSLPLGTAISRSFRFGSSGGDFAIEQNGLKVLLPDGDPSRAEAYDLSKDSVEKHRIPVPPELRDKLLRWMREHGADLGAPDPMAAALAKEREAQMKAIGYIGSETGRK